MNPPTRSITAGARMILANEAGREAVTVVSRRLAGRVEIENEHGQRTIVRLHQLTWPKA